MTQEAKPSLTDRAGFWLAMSAALVTVGGVGIAIAIAEYRRPWTSAWFITGAVVCALGCLSVLWALVLYLARKVADGRYQADRQKFMSDNFSVQQEALIKTKDLMSNISEELWIFHIEQRAAAPAGQPAPAITLTPVITKLKKILEEDRLASEQDFHGLLKDGIDTMELITAWTEKRSAFADKIRIPVNELSASMLLGGSQSVQEAVNAYLKVAGRYIMSSSHEDFLQSIKDERAARERVFAAVGKALREGPFAP